MATQNFINECKNMANANRLGRFELQMYDRFEKEFKGNTLQDGTPTPSSPVPIQSVTGLQNIEICGKNLFDGFRTIGANATYSNGILSISSGGSGAICNSNYFVPSGNRTYYFSYNSSYATARYYVAEYDENYNQIRSNSKTTQSTFTIGNDTKYFAIIWNFASGTTFPLTISNMQLEKGSTATTYEPYKGNTYEVNLGDIELNKIGDYQDSIKKSSGKNLFDKDNMNTLNAYINGSGIIKTDVNASVLYIPCKPNTSYAIQKPLQTTTSSNRFKVGCCSSIPTTETQLSKYNNLPNGTTNTTMIFETDSTANYLVFNFAGGNQSEYQNVINSIQIEENSQATSYEPYGKVWYIEKKIGKVVLDGSEGWQEQSSSTANHPRFRIYTLSYDYNMLLPSSNNNTFYGLCNNFKPLSTSNTYNSNQGISLDTTSNLAFYVNDITTLEDFKTWLSTHNTEVDYVLATPTYTEITNEELINQLEAIQLLKGTNNISITSGNLPVIFDYSFWNGNTEVDEDDRFLEVNQSNYLTSIELKDSCCVNNNILGTTYTKSAEVELLDLPVGTKLESQIITPEIGVKYNDDTTEYETFDDYVIESLNDEQTASNTKFTAMNGSTLLDKEYICSLSFENGQTHTINEFYQDACNQIGLTPTDSTFDNSEIVMTGNPFTNKETIRTVISEVEKTSCSIAKFDWKNKTISLTWLSDQIDYEFNTSDYSTLEGSLTQYGPLNTIIIANAQLDGENVVMTNEESVAEYGEHQIIIDSPYFLYTEELRTQAIQAIYNKLDGLTYYDLKLTTPYGKPFLNIGDKIRINTNENQVYDTYVLSHTFKYDGTFSSIIESPALTQEEQTIKNEFKGNSVREKLRRTELIVDKTTGDITAITDRVTTVENEFGDVYSKEEVNTLVQNSATGITNTFVNSGGNNLLRNTGLWFEDRSEIEYMYPRTTGLYPSDELFMSADPHWEYWKGNAKKVKEDKAANMSGILLQTGYFEQQQQIRNGTYTLSFKYRKLIELATVNVQINDRYLDLTNIEDTEIIEVGEITAQNISIKIFSDTDDSCIIYDLMLNTGSEKAEYSQHQNETTTDTVNISKGITIQSSDTNTTFKANSDGIRVYNSRDMDTPITEYTDTGMDTNRIKVKDEAEIVQVLWKNVGNNTWISRL